MTICTTHPFLSANITIIINKSQNFVKRVFFISERPKIFETSQRCSKSSVASIRRLRRRMASLSSSWRWSARLFLRPTNPGFSWRQLAQANILHCQQASAIYYSLFSKHNNGAICHRTNVFTPTNNSIFPQQ